MWALIGDGVTEWARVHQIANSPVCDKQLPALEFSQQFRTYVLQLSIAHGLKEESVRPP
jgi:hypothetical protein